MGIAAAHSALEQHPFVARLLQHITMTAADLKSLDAIIDGELVIRKRRDLIVDGYEYRKLCFVKDGLCRALQAAAQRQAANPQRGPARRHRRPAGKLLRARGLFGHRHHRPQDACLRARCLRSALLPAPAIRPGADLVRGAGSRPPMPSTSSTSDDARRSNGCRIFCWSCTPGSRRSDAPTRKASPCPSRRR